MDTLKNTEKEGISSFLFWLSAIIVSILYVQGFFWGDDCRIIFQVVENMYEGFGPVYTQGDRVQVHTSPLWTYYLLLFRLFTSDYKVIILLSSLIPLWGILAWFRIFYRPYSFLLLAILFLSNVLFGYWGSGLGNPLHYALITVLFHAFVREKTKLFIFIAALMLANRLDATTIVVPFSILIIRRYPFKQNMIQFLHFGWPFYLHLVFSFIYYGDIYPNAYYAKVATIDPSVIERIVAFCKYLMPTVLHNPIDILFFISPFMLFIFFRRELIGIQKTNVVTSLAACGLTLFYVFWVGSDHLYPRLLGVPLWTSLLILFEYFMPRLHREIKAEPGKMIAPGITTGAIVFVMAAFSTFIPIRKLQFMHDKDYGKHPEYHNRIKHSDDSFIYHTQIITSHHRVIRRKGGRLLKRGEKNLPRTVGFVAEAGTALQMGAKVHLIDYMGLADPVMSRIKTTQASYRPGHNYRPIPKGYPETLMEGTNQIVHPDIAVYYDRLKNVISGDLLSLGRFNDIFYLMTHSFPVDPNDPKNASYFLSPQEYDQVFEEKYGIYYQLENYGEEFRFYRATHANPIDN